VGSPIKISEAASLALNATALMVGEEAGRVSTEAMADRLGASVAHLHKVLQRLAKSGLVVSSRGPGGGYGLARPPKDVTLLELYEVVDGPLEISHCPLGAHVCGHTEQCPLGLALGKAGNELKEALSKTTLADYRTALDAGKCV
jgi:Rrf2 family protein